MNKKRVLATAMSALMIVSSTPVAAIAEVANQSSAASGAVAAGLNPDANGGQELNAALGDAANGDNLTGGGSSQAAEAPAFKLADHLYDSGTLSYKFVDENGKEVNSDAVALFKVTDGGITASDPVEQDGRWVATLKIDASKVDPANFAPSWAVSDPQDYELDANQSKLTVEYKTDSTEPTATSYYATGSDRGSLVFVKKPAKPAEPTLDVKESAELSQADLASAQSVYDLFGVSAKDAQGTEVADTEVDYTIKDADGKAYVAGDWLRDSTPAGTYTITWTYAGVTKTTTVTVKAAYTLEAPAEATLTAEQVKGFSHGTKDLAKAVLTKAVDNKGNDVTDQVTVDITDEQGGYVSFKQFKNAASGTYYVKFTIGSASVTTKVTVGEAKPEAPKFDIDKVSAAGKNVEVHVVGSDRYTTVSLDSADVASVTEPKEVDGAWQVTVTLKTPFADLSHYWLPSAWGDSSDYVLDEGNENNKLTMTFRTTDLESDDYFSKWPNTAVVYFKKAAEQAPAAPTAEELENVYGAVTFGGDATSTLPAYLEAGYYTPAKAVEKQADGTYTFTATVPNTKDAAAKYLEQKGGSADDLEYDDKTSATTVTFAYDASAKTWNLKTPAKLVLNKKPAPAITKDNFDFSQDAVRVRDDDSDDTLDTLPLIDGTYDLSKLDMTKYTNVGGALVIDLPISDAQKYVDAYNEAHPDTYYVLASDIANSVTLRYYQGKWGISAQSSVYVKQGEKPASKAAIELSATSATVSEYGLTKLGDLGVNTWVKKVTLADGTVVSADDYWKTTNPVIKDASGSEHTLVDGLKPGEYTITYTLDDGSATATLKLTVTASTYDLRSWIDDDVTLADAKKLSTNKAFIDKYVTKAQTGDGEDFKDDVTVSVYKGSVSSNNHLTARQFAAQAEEGGTYIVVFEYDPDATEPYLATAQTKLTIGTPAPEAPAFDAQNKLNTAGIVDLVAVDENGKTLAEDTTGVSVNSLYDFPADVTTVASVTKPEQQADGTWKVVATLDASKLPADAVKTLDSSFDPSQFELDTAASKLTVEFQTGTGKFDKNSYSSTANLGQHAKVVFKKKAAEPVEATVQVSLNDGVDTGASVTGTVGQKLNDLEWLDAKYKNPTRKGYKFLGYKSSATGKVEQNPTISVAFEIFTAQWEAEQEPTLITERDEATLTSSQIKGLEDDDQAKALRDAFGVKATAADGSDATAQVRASSINQATSQQGYFDLLAGKPGTYTVIFTFDAANDLYKQVTLTVTEDPKAPAFDAQAALNTVGSVAVRADYGTGQGYQDQTFTYVNAEDLKGLVKDQAEPALNEQTGNWEVTLTLDPAAVKAKVNPSLDDSFSYVEDGSRTTVTFETSGATGTQWYVKPQASALFLFQKKAAPKAPEFNLNADGVGNVAGNVTVRTVDQDGKKLAEDTTGYSLSRLFGFPEDLTKYATASKPEQQADGTWKVTVTFDASKLDPADVLVSQAQWGDASQYEFDAADSTQTIAFQTEGNSTQYYAQGAATVTYKKKAAQPEVAYELVAKKSANVTPADAKAFKEDADFVKRFVTKATADGKDVTKDVEVTVSAKDSNNALADFKAGKEGSYTVAFKLGDKTATTAVTVKANNGGGNGGGSTGGNGGGTTTPSTPSYKLILPETIDGGSVETNGTSFKSGATVTVKPASKEGYRLAGLKVTDKDGKQLTITDGADGAYAFEMPSSDVTLEPVFTKVEPKSFADVADGQWYKPGVDYASANGLMNGYEGSNDFGVGKSLTRGELATLLFNNVKPGDSFNDYRLSKNQTGFADVEAGQFYTPAANWAVKNRVVNGYADAQGNRTGFGPNDAVTLEQLLAILSNYADKGGAQGADTSVLNGFVDGGSVDAWAAKSVAWAVQKGLVHGYDTPEGKRLDPIQTISRERVATVLLNAKTLGIL